LSSVRVFSVDVPAVRREMDEYAREVLATHPEVEEIIVFGSFENDTYAPGSILMFSSSYERQTIHLAIASLGICLTNHSLCLWMFSRLRARK